MILKAADPPGRRPAGGVLLARPAIPWRVGTLDHSWKPLPCGSGTLPAPRNTTVRAMLPRGDVPGNPIDAHLLQMISPELKLVAPASQGLASRCQGRFILILGLTGFRATSRGGIRNVVSPPRRSYVPSDGTRKRRCSSRRPSSA